MDTVNINLYSILKNDFKLSESKALEFVKAIKEEVQSDIKIENNEYKSILKDDFHKIDLRFEVVRGEIKDVKSDMIKWFFAFFITLVLMILGLYATILFK
jgi:hypothetical protein